MDADVVAELRDRLRRHPADRQPLQHATAQFHLGGVLLADGALDDAEAAFAEAAALFGARGALPEQAKALNGLGATLRTAGRPGLAVRAFEHAAAGLAAAGLPLDEGAARCNLGVALREEGRAEEGAAELRRAVELLDPAQVPAQAAAAARELGITLLGLGALEPAEAVLLDAVALADRILDAPVRAAATNALGLTRLSAGRPQEAVEAFAAAAAASPRGVRPEAFAMAKANLALACERAGAPARARLAARQALASPVVDEPVRAQAAGILERLDTAGDDLRVVLEEEPTDEGRERIAREELLRAADVAGRADLVAGMREWLAAHTASELEPVAVAELWLGGLLELPPAALERLARAALEASLELGDEERETFRSAVTRGMARFHVPQMMRLRDVFATAAADAGGPVIVAVSADLSAEALAAAVPGRPLRTYPALLSTDADAVAWARAGAPPGAVVTADYQASARGRGGVPWTARPGRDLSFSVILRPAISADDEGWVYVAAALAVLEVLGGDATVEWPDRILLGGRLAAEVAGHAGLGAEGVAWVVVNLLLYDVPAPRGPLLARLAGAVEAVQLPDSEALARFRERCTTIGRDVVAHIAPTWPDGVQIAGTAVSVLEDGALVIERPDGSRIAVRPQHLAGLTTPDAAPGT